MLRPESELDEEQGHLERPQIPIVCLRLYLLPPHRQGQSKNNGKVHSKELLKTGSLWGEYIEEKHYSTQVYTLNTSYHQKNLRSMDH